MNMLPTTHTNIIAPSTIVPAIATTTSTSTENAAQELLEKLRYLEKIDPEGKLEITQRMNTIVGKGLKQMEEASGKYLHGDSAKSEEPSKVKILLDAIPESLNVKNADGKLPPLRMAFLAGIKWSTKLHKVIHKRANDLKDFDDECGLYPFQQAVVGHCELNVIYDLIRRFPGCLAETPEEEEVDLHSIEKQVQELSIEQMKSKIKKCMDAPPAEPGSMSKADLAKSKKICYHLLNSKYGKTSTISNCPRPKKNKRKLNEGKIEWNR